MAIATDFKSLFKIGEINRIISDLFLENYTAYPEMYQGDDAKEVATSVAKGYFANRNEDEIQRDVTVGVTEADYIEFCLDRLEALKTFLSF